MPIPKTALQPPRFGVNVRVLIKKPEDFFFGLEGHVVTSRSIMDGVTQYDVRLDCPQQSTFHKRCYTFIEDDLIEVISS